MIFSNIRQYFWIPFQTLQLVILILNLKHRFRLYFKFYKSYFMYLFLKSLNDDWTHFLKWSRKYGGYLKLRQKSCSWTWSSFISRHQSLKLWQISCIYFQYFKSALSTFYFLKCNESKSNISSVNISVCWVREMQNLV